MTNQKAFEYADGINDIASIYWKGIPVSEIFLRGNRLVMSAKRTGKNLSVSTLKMWLGFLNGREVDVVVEDNGTERSVTEFTAEKYGTTCNVSTDESRQVSLKEMMQRKWLDELPIDSETDPFRVYVPTGKKQQIPVFM